MSRKRRRRGEGGGIYQRSDGLWVATLSYGYDGKGKRKRWVVYANTKAMALAKLSELRNGPGQLPAAQKVTVGAYLLAWLGIIKSTVRATTWDRYNLLLTRQILPHLDGVNLQSLTGHHIDQFYAALRQQGESDWTVFRAAVTLKSALRAAVRKGMLQANPCDQATRPRVPKSEPRFWTAEEVKTFLAEASSDRLCAFFTTAIMTGARCGELLGLHWPDVHFSEQTITITKTLEEVRGSLTIREPKTARARRRVDLPDAAVEALLDHRKAMLAEGHDVRSGLVFCDRQGGPLRRSNLARRHHQAIIARAAVPRIRIHDLRHTHASLLLASGVHPKLVPRLCCIERLAGIRRAEGTDAL
jgi:integrase